VGKTKRGVGGVVPSKRVKRNARPPRGEKKIQKKTEGKKREIKRDANKGGGNYEEHVSLEQNNNGN